MSVIVTNLKKFLKYSRDVDNSFNLIKLIFHHYGVWPQFKGRTFVPVMPIFQKCVPWFMLVLSAYFTLISSPVTTYLRRNDHIVQFLEPLAFIFMSSMIFVHFVSLMFHGDRYQQVFDTLFEMRSCAAKYALRPEKVRARAKRYTDLIWIYILQIASAGTFVVLLGFPVLMYSRKFLFGSWYPYPADRSPFYELTTLAWMIYISTGGCVMSLNNALLMYFFSFATSHLRLLRYTLENIKPLSMAAVDKQMAADGQKIKFDDKTELQFFLDTRLWGDVSGGSLRRGYFREMQVRKEMEQTIRHCVVHQQIIHRFMDEISSAYGPILIHQLNCCLFPTAMSIVLVLYATEINGKTFMFVAMTMVVFINLFLFCWLAQEANSESSLVVQSVYSCDWLEASHSFKRSMLLVMARCNQPLEVTVAGFIPLNVSLCLQMIKMTYSYYMSVAETMDIKGPTLMAEG